MYFRKISRSKIVFITLIVLVGLLFSGCGSPMDGTTEESRVSEPNSRLDGGKVNGGFDNPEKSKSSKSSQNNDEISQGEKALQERKIIKSARIELETKTFEETTDEIMRRADIVGGYVENSNVTGRRINSRGTSQNRIADFKLRIPSHEFKDFIQEFGNLGNVIVDRREGKDITDQYFDTEARVKTLKIQEERLLEILRKAEKVEDIIELERELSDVRYKIENLTGTIRKWDNLVSYATLNVRVYEVQEVKEVKTKPVTFGEKIKNGFTNSVETLIDLLKGLVILIASLIPFLAIVIPTLVVVVYILRKYNYNNRSNSGNNSEGIDKNNKDSDNE